MNFPHEANALPEQPRAGRLTCEGREGNRKVRPDEPAVKRLELARADAPVLKQLPGNEGETSKRGPAQSRLHPSSISPVERRESREPDPGALIFPIVAGLIGWGAIIAVARAFYLLLS